MEIAGIIFLPIDEEIAVWTVNEISQLDMDAAVQAAREGQEGRYLPEVNCETEDE